MKISDTYALRTRVAVILEGKIQRKYNIRDANNCRAVDILGALSIYFNRKLPPHILYRLLQARPCPFIQITLPTVHIAVKIFSFSGTENITAIFEMVKLLSKCSE